MGELNKTTLLIVLIIVCFAAIVLISGIVCLLIGIKKDKSNVVFLGACLIGGSISFIISFLCTLLKWKP